MVLAYEDTEDKDRNRIRKKREVFEKHLQEQGLELETELKTVNKYQMNSFLEHLNFYTTDN